MVWGVCCGIQMRIPKKKSAKITAALLQLIAAVLGGPEDVRVITEALGQYCSEREVVGLTNRCNDCCG